MKRNPIITIRKGGFNMNKIKEKIISKQKKQKRDRIYIDIYTPIEITQRECNFIIDNFEPLGTFYLKEKDKIIGIDNQTGQCFVEEFNSLEVCKKFLNHEITVFELDEIKATRSV